MDSENSSTGYWLGLSGLFSPGTSADYTLAKPLRKGSYVAVTLAWDRLVELGDDNKNGKYDKGEFFRDRGLNNLDLHLVKADGNKKDNRSTCASVSKVDSVEHIFLSRT